ncbi:MAG: hypothetical protein LC798_15565 [Chloroflexi bacterium]|nr:hypothetical protein [Chloroflexota bacterium]
MFDRPADEVRELVRGAVMQRAVELQERRDRNLAVRTANAMNGAKMLDGRAGGTSTA